VSEADRSPVRPPIAVLLSRFPRVTETFILREVIELERRGWPVTLVPLMREHAEIVHPEAVAWTSRALFTGWISKEIVASLLRTLRRRPLRLLATVARLKLGNLRSPGFLAKSLLLFPKAVHLAERLREAGVTHVHAHFATHPATVAWVIERLAGIPYSVTVHAHDIFVDRAFLAPKLRRARFVRVISEFNRRYLAERYPSLEDRLERIHVGIEPERYRPPPAGRREREPGEPVRVLTVAALELYKGIDLLIEVAAILRDCPDGPDGPDGEGVPPITFDVVGEGYHRYDLENHIASHELEGVVRLVGAVAQDEVARRMAAADLFLMPSIIADDGQMEGIPVALMEALASELPVVATRLSGIPELVEDGVTGLLVDPEDWDQIADSILRLVRDQELARRLGRAGRERVEAEFSLRSTVAELAARIDDE
jgi:glycosyltransferase involved in cell wall biosynthesis